MTSKSVVIKGRYYDSVSLMNVARKVNALPDIIDSAVVMGTAANKEILRASGIYAPEFDGADDGDLLIAVKGAEASNLEGVIGQIELFLAEIRKGRSSRGEVRPRSIEGALEQLPDAGLVMISVAGQYAGEEAMKALEHGLHVMLFSDNVPLETEIALKQYAHAHGRIVMGPDCGTAIINGVPLAFANVVRRGDIGAVAAAGTGLQEVTCLISNHGGGISQAIGTGGRDVKQQVGGISLVDGLEALAQDDSTKVIVLVSKPPHPEVMEKIGAKVASVGKPVVAVFLGADRAEVARLGMIPASTLEEASMLAVAVAGGSSLDGVGEDICRHEGALRERAAAERARLQPQQRYVRGLFSGGTFCYEAQLVLRPRVGEVWSNTPVKGAGQLDDANRSVGHTIVDLGDDQFTVGKPHPMIDFSTRNRRIVHEAADPETAVIVLDLVLGFGSNMAPLADLLPALAEAQQVAADAGRYLPIVVHVTGTDDDPQNRSACVEMLRRVGAIVERSNAAASTLAAYLVATA